MASSNNKIIEWAQIVAVRWNISEKLTMPE